MNNLQQARDAKLSITSTIKDLSVGIARDNFGFYLKVHLSELVNHNIPSEINGIKVIVEVTGLSESY
jgi:hypothetical protein